MTAPPARRWLRLEPASRVPRVEPAAIIGVLVLAALVIGWELYTNRTSAPLDGTPPTLCLVRNATGVPCPGCGGTRAVKSALALDPLEAFAHNPLLVLAAVCFASVLLFRLITAQAVRLDFTQRGWLVVGIIFGMGVLLNWIWVLLRHGTIGG